MKIKTYVINLKESVDRRERVKAEMEMYSCMDIKFVEAVDGKSLSPVEIKKRFNVLKFIYKYIRTPKRGEIGCTLSHQECYRRFLDSEDEFVLILEDDITFLCPEKLEMLLTKIAELMTKSTPYIFTLSTHTYYYRKKVDKIDGYSFYKLWDAWGACAYLINRKAAERLLSTSRPFIVADDFEYMRKIGIVIEGLYPTFAAGASSMERVQTEIQEGDVDYIFLSDMPFQYRLKYYIKRISCEFLLLIKVLAFRNYSRGCND